ncbi:fatty acid desaturase [Sphingomonas limnosediminicola]|jgi:omega-6 fatty acid desaturase (delta-12 desaturase)|uniref:Fatty acid desaturase n=1 Tax=Sphingomonas limnosediminicola TaxID=940133 RepID=A0ABP7LY88_9SPHN
MLNEFPEVHSETEEPTQISGREAPIDPRRLVRDLHAFRDPSVGRSLRELAVTLAPFLALIAITLVAVEAGYVVALLLIAPASLFLLRLFLIQHDCGHDAFFPSRRANDWLGRFLGVLTLTPYDCWKRSHALHHSTTGNLDARGFGDVDTLTVREFLGQNRWKRLLYRFYRHPVVLFGIAPTYLFLLRHRLPVGLMKAGSRYWVSALATNATTVALVALGTICFGLSTILFTFVPVVLLAASLGVWLFYIQHQFEEAHWDRGDDWSFHDAALHGSSHLELPRALRWFTANIGIHHVHHLSSRIPFYRLPEVLERYPQLVSINRFTAVESLKALRYSLWDEQQRRMVSFSAVSAR